METLAAPFTFRNRRLVLLILGILFLAVGLGAAVLGPLEMICFYFFSAGGRFHYEGFGFGSFMFGNLATQIMGYYLIAALCIPLGYGHLRLRRWARTLALASLGSWVVLGIPLAVVFVVILLLSKDLPPSLLFLLVPALVLAYPILPALLIRFYRSRHVQLTFDTNDPRSYWIERRPLATLVLCMLFLFYLVVMHVLIFFNGAFPFFGDLLVGMPGFILIDVSILALACLIWGTLRSKGWAWWGALVYFGFLTASSMLTLSRLGLSDLYPRMRFAPLEMEIFQGLPPQVQEFHLTALVGIPLLLTLGAIFIAKRHFGATAEEHV